MKSLRKKTLYVFLGLFLLSCLGGKIYGMYKVKNITSTMSTSEFERKIKDKKFMNNISNVCIDGIYLKINTKDSKIIKTANPQLKDYQKILLDNNIKITTTQYSSENILMYILKNYSGLIIMLLVLVYLSKKMEGVSDKFMTTSSNNESFGFIKPTLTFDDVAGNKEAKENLKDFEDFIKNPEKYESLGARCPKGILLHGPSGTGKTLLAKALAGETDINFIAVSGSEFIEKYVGVGASRIRTLFEKARKNAPCIVFIDEIDALCSSRGGSSNSEHDQTLNQLLCEMDGVKNNSQIVIIGATNLYDQLDSAILRPGRFDRHVRVGLPDIQDRKEILQLHSKNKPLHANVNLEEIAELTIYMSGADLENIMNEASIICAKNKKSLITREHIDKAICKVIAGDEKKNKNNIKKDIEICAYHESGHAIISLLLGKKVTKVTVIPTTDGAGGYTLIPPKEGFNTKRDILNDIKVSFGGRVAEELIFGKDNITGGASQDLKNIKSKLETYIKHFGMGDNLICQDLKGEELYKEINKIAKEQYLLTFNLLKVNKSKVELMTQALLSKETIYEEDINALFNGHKEIEEKNEKESLLKVRKKVKLPNSSVI